ncbi:hypothetical protein CI238_02530 [Colletotrichum incanum]|uniref:Uncharacterized protein n=1 Tax=Colletotrichum incanum TaxID=1573173 RepID=A0A167D746_COLIC|nr:hypothetical protein CI238_02530 [Colletotrichum incanum]OHW96673.1 hypothetical protein CSPAE12_04708 [Colletotrichum incanum]
MDAYVHGHHCASNEVICPSNQGRSASKPELQTLLTTPSRQPALGPDPQHLTFLDLPYELRLDIYELLLLTPDPIYVSNHGQQLRMKVEPPEHQIVYLRAPRPRPRVVTLTYRSPHVGILQTCKQINHEATPVLYRKNEFIVGLKLRRRAEATVEPTDLAGFFLYTLRPSTLLQLSVINFRGACHCDQWLTLPAGAGYSTTGNELSSMCPDGWDYPQLACLVISKTLWSLEKGTCFLASHRPPSARAKICST